MQGWRIVSNLRCPFRPKCGEQPRGSKFVRWNDWLAPEQPAGGREQLRLDDFVEPALVPGKVLPKIKTRR